MQNTHKLLLLLFLFASIFHGLCEEYESEWNEWVKRYNKIYGRSNVAIERRAIWTQSHLKILQHNKEADEGKYAYRLGHNEFSDLTFKEFSEKYLTKIFIDPKERFKPINNNDKHTVQDRIKRSTIPNSIDYRNTGYVNPVRDQGACGCCWAFAAVGAIEGAFYKETNMTNIFSPQQLVDCDIGNNNNGCNGGMPERTFDYIKNYGITTDSLYPYLSVSKSTGGNCIYSSSMKRATLSGWTYTSNTSWIDESALTKAIADIGPIAVAIYTTSSFQLYSSGIFYDPTCNPYASSNGIIYPDINHAVVAVGYGVDSSTNKQYYILKNQWGTSWGMSGYMLLERNRNNTCNIASWASYPVGVNVSSSASSHIVLSISNYSAKIIYELYFLLILLQFIKLLFKD